MARTLAFGAALAQGSWPCQEDGFLVDPSRRLFALADGFGGRGAGDMAAKIALAGLQGLSGGAGGGAEAALLGAARAINKQILDRNAGRPPAGRGGVSLLAAWADARGEVCLLQAGAGAAFLVRGGELKPVLVAQAPPREEYQPLLPTEALGLGETPRPEIRSLRLRAGDLLFLASSGVDWETESFRRELLAASAAWLPGTSPEPLVRDLVERASLSAQGWNRTLLAVGHI